tara:strand:- start:798 stop:1346 length:549 start_codon:yes stop_codon:yes gene_type:complete
MIKVTVYGRLRKFIGQSTFEVNADSPKKVLSFLINNFEGLGEHMKDQEYCIMAGNIRITEELLNLYTERDIKIIPVVHGEIPLALIFAGASFAGASLVGAGTFLGLKAAFFTQLGLSFLFQGIDQLLTKQPEERGGEVQDPSFLFTGLVNNTKQGVPINIVYGETIVGSTVVSASIDTAQGT